ncbi:hypothetical protein C9374_006107 [Naegleria lovaniensis]|uniref:HECT-type E3 ubiquitin transferase n=1 Tax=Naegleria lovaniensis TaxID=51637 RepID=A0AA88KJD6_NAELO|nr:uncharacterized protein C9374_006107 [Naegleria lovaniensis]KAG2381723.1 hypothetical protein C9374_006107 [Naegleria lovaniensis]
MCANRRAIFIESPHSAVSTQTNWSVTNCAVQTHKPLRRDTPSQTLMNTNVKQEVYHVEIQTELVRNSIAVQSCVVPYATSVVQTENKEVIDTDIQTHWEIRSVQTQTTGKILEDASIQTLVSGYQESSVQVETELSLSYHMFNALRAMETSTLDHHLLVMVMNSLFISFSQIKNQFPSGDYYPIFLTALQILKKHLDISEERLPLLCETEWDQISGILLFCSSNLAALTNETFIFMLWRMIKEQKGVLTHNQTQTFVVSLHKSIHQVRSKTYTMFALKILLQLDLSESNDKFTQFVCYDHLRDYVNSLDSNSEGLLLDVVNYVSIFSDCYINQLTEDYSMLDILKIDCIQFIEEDGERVIALSLLDKLYHLISNLRISKITGNQNICDLFFITYPENRKITANIERNQQLIIENIESNTLEEIECWELIESRIIQYIDIIHSNELDRSTILNFYVILTFVMSKSASVDQHCVAITALEHLKYVTITNSSPLTLIFRHLHTILQSVEVLETFVKLLGVTWIYDICLKNMNLELVDLSFNVLTLCLNYYPIQHLLFVLSSEKAMGRIEEYFGYLCGQRKKEYLEIVGSSLKTQTELIFKSLTSPSKEYFGEFPLVKFTLQHVDSDLGSFFVDLLNICFSELSKQLSSKTGQDKYFTFCKYLSKDIFGTSLRNCLRRYMDIPASSQELCGVLTLLVHVGNIYSQTQNKITTKHLQGIIPILTLEMVDQMRGQDNSCQAKYVTCIFALLQCRMTLSQQLSILSSEVPSFCLECIVRDGIPISINSPFSKLLSILLNSSTNNTCQRIVLALSENKAVTYNQNEMVRKLEYDLSSGFMKINCSETPVLPILLFSSRFFQSKSLPCELEIDLLERCAYVLREGMNLLLPIEQLVDPFIEEGKKHEAEDMKASLLSTKFKPTISKTTSYFWSHISSITNYILTQLKLNKESALGLSPPFEIIGKKRMKVLNSVLRVISDDQFYAFNIFTQSSLIDLLNACHAFLDAKLKAEHSQWNLLDESSQLVIECITILQRKNSAQNAEKPNTVSLQKVPIIFNLGLKKLIFSIKTTIDLSKPKDEIIVQRDKILECSINEFMKRKKSELQTRQWKIKFKDEETIDILGVRREFITLLCAEICRDSMWNSSEDYKLYPNRDATDRSSLIKFEFFGRLLGKCLIESILVDIRLTKFVYKKLLGKKLCYQDISSIDASLYKNKLLWIRDNDVSEHLCLSFSVEDGISSEVELCPNGKNIAVTNDNKHEYLDLLVDFLLNKDIEKQLLALYKGFQILLIFNEFNHLMKKNSS